MKSKNFKPKVQKLDQVKLDFPDVDDDHNLKEAVDELKRKGEEKLKVQSKKRLFTEIS